MLYFAISSSSSIHLMYASAAWRFMSAISSFVYLRFSGRVMGRSLSEMVLGFASSVGFSAMARSDSLSC